MGLPDEEASAKGFIKGYETGLREAFDEVINLATRKSFTTTELLLVVKNQKVAIPEKVMMRKRKILKETGIDLINITGPRLEVEKGVAPGSSLFIKEKFPTTSFRIFNQLIASGSKGMVISRSPRENTKAKVNGECVVYWLTKYDLGDEQTKQWYIQPTDLPILQSAVKKFVGINKDVQIVIMLDGLNYLISNNDYLAVLRMVQKLKDELTMIPAVFIVSADPASLSPNEVVQLENEMLNVVDTK
ncbi:MAG: hypothetical protein A4E32_00015 [Methanomassiliicoccales archaeon PtaU1.Bin124]|nr:MAG: hypothetical protein A4E32_00015 [Methanomassiliicoccales archaeon PtaU1.Bin124]